MSLSRNFASDNCAVVHPDVMRAISTANRPDTPSYGEDAITDSAIKEMQGHFGGDAQISFVKSSTSANAIALASATFPGQAILCPETAHAMALESSAIEHATGCKLVKIASKDGKITPKSLQNYFDLVNMPRPTVLSIAQPTEYGTVYSLEELQELSDIAHKRGLYFHMDGARLSNAVAHLKCTLFDVTDGAGVDVLSFGQTKNGAMDAESIISFSGLLRRDVATLLQRQGQGTAKMGFVSAQFRALFGPSLWYENAEWANRMATLLLDEICDINGIDISRDTQTNAVFARLPYKAIEALRREYDFYLWKDGKRSHEQSDKDAPEIRFMTSFDKTERDIGGLVSRIREEVSNVVS
jgi:threonine aldolase